MYVYHHGTFICFLTTEPHQPEPAVLPFSNRTFSSELFAVLLLASHSTQHRLLLLSDTRPILYHWHPSLLLKFSYRLDLGCLVPSFPICHYSSSDRHSSFPKHAASNDRQEHYNLSQLQVRSSRLRRPRELLIHHHRLRTCLLTDIRRRRKIRCDRGRPRCNRCRESGSTVSAECHNQSRLEGRQTTHTKPSPLHRRRSIFRSRGGGGGVSAMTSQRDVVGMRL